MSGLEKAKLYKLTNDREPRRIQTIPVQFNPASLRLTLTNNTEGGQSSGRQARQYMGNASTELAFDLVFDTADEDDGSGGPRSVREKTCEVEQFVLAQVNGTNRQSPPKVEFEWGGLKVQGVISSLTVEFDLFAGDGTPLRAKMSVSIKEQDARYELMKLGQGASQEGGAPDPGDSTPAGPGNSGGGADDPASNRTGVALAGESLADFSLRMGLEPGAWRGLAAGLEGTLSLEAGLEIDFDASLSLSAGVGVSVGFEADLGLSLEASLGLSASAGISVGASAGAGASASMSAGFALAAAGGVSAAAESVRIAKAQAAVGASVQAFGASGVAASASVPTGGSTVAAAGAAAAFLPPAPPSAPSVSPASSSAPSFATASVSAAATSAAGSPAAAATSVPTAYAPPVADPRAVSYGFGVPLRPRTGGGAQGPAGVVALRPYARGREAPVARDPATPPWAQLPAASRRTTAAPAGEANIPIRRKVGRTGCGCGCGPEGGAR